MLLVKITHVQETDKISGFHDRQQHALKIYPENTLPEQLEQLCPERTRETLLSWEYGVCYDVQRRQSCHTAYSNRQLPKPADLPGLSKQLPALISFSLRNLSFTCFVV